MWIKFSNSNKKYFFLLLTFYFLSLIILFKFFELHLSKLGDYIYYSRGVFNLSLNPEELTTNIYTILSYTGITPTILGLTLSLYISYIFVNNLSLTKLNIFIFFCIMNPFVFQYLIYPSKELILTCFSILIYKFKNHKLLEIFLITITFIIRPLYFITIIVLLVTTRKKILNLNINTFTVIFTITILLSVFYIEYSEKVFFVTNYIKNLFLPYDIGTTNRYWLPVVETILSFEFITWISVGLYTLFFSFLDAPSIIIKFLVMIVGFGKIILIYNFFKIRFTYGYLWLTSLIIYGVPLSIYNVGSSLRFTIPITIIILYSYIILKKEIIDER